ncbi:HNH endonuclease [Aeromicrobium sp. YIM 150415]|uniref:HNH endonuclease n=1 Tax=Aeromicrobium sp. YIM 150415 TaxID=2803912 RepID=UPI001963ED58|nr:HNH endonuclease signature motif containing protein [Aeromicrobium sp. YIM 150415]MBM9464657.1 HNH endonuclease [Aeromicrobium sp. YIM 150415]
MADERPTIPKPIERQVKVEAGHRCAIPTCRGTSALEIAHIIPWSKVRSHTFENLILLCAVCHTRYDNGEIDRLAMKQYKANLAVLSNRYGEYERRVLEIFAGHDRTDDIVLTLPAGRDLDLWYLLADGILRKTSFPGFDDRGMQRVGDSGTEDYVLTQPGRVLVRSIREAGSIE